MRCTVEREGKGTRSRSGFSFVEVMGVLVLIGILAAVTIPLLTDSEVDLRAEVERIKGHLTFAQSRSMGNDTANWGINFSADSYTLERRRQTATIPLPDENGPTRQLPAGVRVTSGLGRVQFDEWGSPGGQSVVVTLNGSTSITITRNTGFIP